jgi:hypothetical protein
MMCPEKVGYATLRGAAEVALEQLEAGRVQRAYPCPHCSRYHLTSQPMNGGSALTAEMVRSLARSVGAVSPFVTLRESPYADQG